MAMPLLSRDPIIPFTYEGVEYQWERPPLYDAQFEALFSCPDPNGKTARYGICEASTKAGKTVGCMAWLAEQAVTGHGDAREYWWIAPVYRQAKIAYSRMKRALPAWVIASTNDTDNVIVLFNSNIIRFRSAEKPDNLYGDDVYAAVVDEASRMREAAWFAIRSTLTATRGPVRIIGNVKGRGNWFYKIARKAQLGAPDHAYRKMTAYDAVAGGVLAMEEVEDAKASLPEDVFRELYLAEGTEDGSNPFGQNHIDAAACLEMYSEERTVCYGIDLGDRNDWTVITGLDKYGDVTGIARFRRVGWPAVRARVAAIVKDTPALIDSTGSGQPITDDLMRLCAQMEPFTFTSRSKQHIMEGLAFGLQAGEIRWPDSDDGAVLKQEMSLFEYVTTGRTTVYGSPEGYGFHDDTVCSLALAREKLRRLYPVAVARAGPGAIDKAGSWFGAASGGQHGDEDGAHGASEDHHNFDLETERLC